MSLTKRARSGVDSILESIPALESVPALESAPPLESAPLLEMSTSVESNSRTMSPLIYEEAKLYEKNKMRYIFEEHGTYQAYLQPFILYQCLLQHMFHAK